MGSYPKGWSAYLAHVAHGDLPSDTVLARFAARYRVARQLKRVEFAGLGTRTEEAYTAVLGVALAYSALEALEKAPGLTPKSIKVVDDDVARRIRAPRHRTLRAFLESPEVFPGLRRRVDALLSAESADVRPAAEVIRNALFHGALTAHGSGVAISRSLLALMDDLAEAVLDATAERFADWLREQLEEA